MHADPRTVLPGQDPMLLLGSEAPVMVPSVADFSLLFLQSKSPLFSLCLLSPMLLTMLRDIRLFG